MKPSHASTHSMVRGLRPHGPSAFTLIEMVVSLSVISIVFLAMGSVMLVTAKAMPSPDSPTNLILDATDVLEQMASELQVATSVTAATDKGIIFTVPDRDNDDIDETISYLWDGTAGTPFCRRYNGGAWVAVMPGIKGFQLSYDTIETTTYGDPVTSDEVDLFNHDSAQDSKDFDIKWDKWVGQCIVPVNLPTDATGWSVTRLMFRAKAKGGTSGVSRVQLRIANADNTPSYTVLEEYTLSESDLSDVYTWQTYAFNSVTGINPIDRICLVIQWANDIDACTIEYDSKSGGGFVKTGNAGVEWEVDAGKSLVFHAYGTYTTPGPKVTTHTLRSVSVILSPSDAPASQARVSVSTLNTPVMP